LNGALLLVKPENVSMVATDGHRLALVEKDCKIAGLSNELRVLIPRKAMGELLKLMAEADEATMVDFAKDESHLFFSVGERVLISRMLTGQFPNYEAVLPRENNRSVELDRDLLASAVRRVALLADERSRAIRVQIDKNKLEISSTSGELGEAHESLDVEFGGDALQIGFNFQYLLDFLDVLGSGGKVRMEFKDEQSAGQLRPAGEDTLRYRYIIMPMRI